MITENALCQQTDHRWIDVENPSDDEIMALGQKYGINSLFLQDVLQPEHLPKWELSEEDAMYFLIARYADPTTEKSADTIHALSRKIAIFLKEGLMITIHRGNIVFVDELRAKAVLANSRYKTTQQLFCRLLKEVFRSYEKNLELGSRELEYYEGKILQNRHLPPFLKGLFLVRRRSSVIRKLLLLSKPLLDALRDMDLAPSYAADTKDMFTRIETLSEDLFDRSASLITMHLALADQRANQVMKVLTLFSAFFLPNTFIVGIYGMNFEYMPELQQPYGYFAVLGFMATVSLGIFIWFRRAGWM
jgi:magnesium transporter